MTNFSEFLRSLEVIAARRRGSFTAATPLGEVVGHHGIGPKTFVSVLEKRFNKSRDELDLIDLQQGRITLMELFCELHATGGGPFDTEIPF